MKHRNPLKQILLLIVTLGVYAAYWLVSTKREMVALGRDIPTAWLMLVPGVNLWWMWRYCQGVEEVTDRRLSAPVSLLLIALLGAVGLLIVQDTFNKHGMQAPARAAIA